MAVGIIPYLIAILVAIGMFRASGAMDWLLWGIEKTVAFVGLNTDFVGALPTALMKPLSGSGARGMMLDTMNTYGAKEGFKVAVGIIPYLIAILVAIGMFRASGAMDWLLWGIEKTVAFVGLNTDFVGALPTALMKPLSGSGARGMMLDTMNTYGADAFVSKLACIVQGSTDTTFYILALYFGSVGITKTRNALTCGLS